MRAGPGRAGLSKRRTRTVDDGFDSLGGLGVGLVWVQVDFVLVNGDSVIHVSSECGQNVSQDLALSFFFSISISFCFF